MSRTHTLRVLFCLLAISLLGCSGETSSGAPPSPQDGTGGSGGEPGDPGGGGSGGNDEVPKLPGDPRSETCGDGFLDPGEACDHGEANSDTTPNACRSDCSAPSCGDGVTDTIYGEECDDGPGNDDTHPNACREDCSRPFCGDGIVDDEYDELCDDGLDNSNAPDARCRLDCKPGRCGDGIVDTGEECDDGALNSDIISSACRSDCTLPFCGDGVIDFGETCDDGEANGTPASNCRADCSSCGDNAVDTEHGEICDNGARNSDTAPDACRTDCRPFGCGDGVIDSNEQCDGANLGGHTCESLGFLRGTLSCTPFCRFDLQACDDDAICGDGIRTGPGEQCDDGGKTPGDGCDEDCRLEDGGVCGTMIDLNAEGTVTGTKPRRIEYRGSTRGSGAATAPSHCTKSYLSGEDVTFGYWVEAQTDLIISVRSDGDGSQHAVFVRTKCSEPGSEMACGDGMVPGGATSGAVSRVTLDDVMGRTQLYITVDTVTQDEDTGGNFVLEVLQDELIGIPGDPSQPLLCKSDSECAGDFVCLAGKCMPPCRNGICR